MLLSVSNVVKAYGVDAILTGVTFRLDAREKVALVGRNGTGKTTLLKILTGQLDPDGGTAQLARGAKVGYLRQEQPVAMGHTVLEEAQSAVESQLAMRSRLAELERRMEEGLADADDVEEYALLHEHFLEAEGYAAERDVRTVLRRMGFEDAEFEKTTDLLSGGERTRLAIARLLLEEPDLLILDEPTNHLDLQATEWLEGWIRSYHGAVLLVSHDREFLENTADRVLEMRGGQVKSYPGPFERFLELKSAEDARQAEVARRQEQEIAKLDEYVRRFMNSQRTAQARGRLKLMNRLVEGKVEAPKNERGMKAAFKPTSRSGDLVVDCEQLAVGFPDETLFTGLDWTVRYGDRWGVIGENGAGKSTLLRTVLGKERAVGGRVRLGVNVQLGYFSQDTDDLDPEKSPLDVMVWDLDMQPGEARNLLGRFLFSGDDVFRPVKTLSGGEKNKLSLAKLTRINPNLLILDEPTNHLDMDSREALADVLREYKGTLILISHDRWLLGRCTEQTLDVRRAGPVVFTGGYHDYRRRRNGEAGANQPKAGPATIEATLSPRELSKEIGRAQKAVEQIESEVQGREEALAQLEARLAAIGPGDDVLAMTQDHQRLQEELTATMAEWEALSLRLEQLRAMQSG